MKNIANIKDERLKQKNMFDGELMFGVRQFNMKTGRDKHNIRIKEEKKQFVDDKTGRIKEGIYTSRSCPVCSTNNAKEIFVKDGFPYLKCVKCEMIYVSKIIKEEYINSFYKNEDSFVQVALTEIEQKMLEGKFAYGLDRIEEHVNQKKYLLDIGCGTGEFLIISREKGWDVQGVEFNKKYIECLKKNNISVIDKPFDQASLPKNYYNCVSLWTVLEHISNPLSLLNDIYQLLTIDGIIFVLVPNVDGLACRILQKDCVTFAGETHINMFNIKTLTKILEDTGYEILSFETMHTLIGTVNNYMNYESPELGMSSEVFDFLTPKYIHDNLLGHLLMVVAKKINPGG